MHRLRTNNIFADMDYSKRSLKAQMRQANDSDARFCIIIGEDELAKDVVSLRDMVSGEQELVKQEEVVEELNKRMENSVNQIEGYIVRLAREYHYSEFRNVCGKYVRKDHVSQNHGHWSQRKIIKNEISTDI